MLNKEQIYDAQISPLMTQIIAICHEHKISMLATYDIPTDEDDALACTTCTANESGKPSERIAACNRAAGYGLRAKTAPMMMTVEHADGSKTLTAIIG